MLIRQEAHAPIAVESGEGCRARGLGISRVVERDHERTARGADSADSPALIRRSSVFMSGSMATNALRTAWSEGASRSRPQASQTDRIRAAANSRTLIKTVARHLCP